MGCTHFCVCRLGIKQCEERCHHKGKAEARGLDSAGCGQLSRYKAGRRGEEGGRKRDKGRGKGVLEMKEREWWGGPL